MRLSFRRSQSILQSEAAECGLACLAMVANDHGHDIGMAEMRQRFSLSLKGATLADLIAMASALGLGARALRLEVEDIERLRVPAVLHWDLDHFVVLRKASGRKATIDDPALGRRTITLKELGDHFTGVALELTPAVDFKPVAARRRLKISDLWSRISGLTRSAIQTLVLSVIIQLTLLSLPFYLQLALDEAVASFDVNILAILALAFGFIYFVSAAGQALRSWVLLTLGQELTVQIQSNLIRHLLRLGVGFFEKRHVGDLTSRLESIQPIERLLTQGVIAILIDGAMSALTLVIMLIYSWRMTAAVVVSVLAYAAIAAIVFPLMRRAQDEQISARANEQTFLIETIRGIHALKNFNAEPQREGVWRNKATQTMTASVKLGLNNILIKLAETSLFGLQIVLIVYLGALQVIGGELTSGMLFAFMAYRQSFADSATRLVSQMLDLRLLGLHLERLADIAHAPPESDSPGSEPTSPVNGAIALRGVTYRYGSAERAVLDNLSIDIADRSFVAITGPSGGGKTTLMKVMLGLLPPERGEALMDGLPLSSIGASRWRARFGVVMQDDLLFTGTIADNISFFDRRLDMGRVAACARQAMIHDEIVLMPMGYSSWIGDMGAALSGGQRQRVLIARALYRRPNILFLDEGTANLDERREEELAAMIESLDITRIVVAHRPELVRRAHRVYELNGGKLRERAIGAKREPMSSFAAAP